MSKNATTKEIQPTTRGRMATRVVATCALLCPERGLRTVHHGDAPRPSAGSPLRQCPLLWQATSLAPSPA